MQGARSTVSPVPGDLLRAARGRAQDWIRAYRPDKPASLRQYQGSTKGRRLRTAIAEYARSTVWSTNQIHNMERKHILVRTFTVRSIVGLNDYL